MSFTGEPGRDDSNLPPINVEIPDDARDLDRDVLAYHRELRAQRRRQRLLRLLRPLARHGFGRPGAVVPLIATCVALSMLAGAMLSVVTVSPASAPTTTPQPPASAPPSPLASLPPGKVELDGKLVSVRSLVRSALVLVPPDCDCGTAMRRLASQAAAADVGVYFVYYAPAGADTRQMAAMTARYGAGVAKTVLDTGSVLFFPFSPRSLTALLVHSDATADVLTAFPPGFQLGPVLRTLRTPGGSASPRGPTPGDSPAAVSPRARLPGDPARIIRRPPTTISTTRCSARAHQQVAMGAHSTLPIP